MQVGALSDNADFRGVGPCASIRTTRHANAERFIAEAGCIPDLLNLARDLRPYPFAFGDSLAASGQRGASHRLTQHRRQISGSDDAVSAQQPINDDALVRRDAGQEKVLLGRESYFGP